ncbi:MAG TPA: proton-conducting transporter membrane subunit [Candidatus Dormibacteraeota bacterium]|nr:proton-conducting transporter membrane subunit [Candidatus Dormibacteraeota bacterium]
MSALLLTAASAASTARAGGFHFDPASTLPWAVPLILAAPVVGYVLVLGSVRTRRGAATVALFTVVVMLAATLLTSWARLRQAAPYKAAYQWINVPVAFTGDQRFQGFGIDLAFRLDHAALAALVALLIIVIAGLAWHRVGGRGEQGPVRFQVNALLLALGAAGVLVSGDLAELLGFWLLAGIATYLLLGHRWGTEGAGRRSRIALALPLLGDVALLCAVGLLYSRFGTLSLDGLYPVLHNTLGVGLKSLTAAAVLVFAAVAIRACIWPFTAWQTGTVDAPAASLALVAGVWPILAGSLLLRTRPLLDVAGVQGPRIVLYTLGVAAVVGPLLSLVGVELRRSILLASSGAIALALIGMVYPDSVSIGFTVLLAVAAARTAGLLAGASAASTMRTVDLRFMGGGWERMPLTSLALLLSAAVLALGGLEVAMLRPRSLAWVALAAGVALVALAALRPYFAIAHGELKRRRAFEPARVREVQSSVTGSALAIAVLGAVALVLAFLPFWLDFLGAGGHGVRGLGPTLLWVLAPLAGAAAAVAGFWRLKDAGLEMCARLGERFGVLWEQAGALYDRFFARPGGRIVGAVEDVGVPGVEAGVGRALNSAGGLAGLAERGLPWVPTVLGLAVVLAVAFGLLTQGLGR